MDFRAHRPQTRLGRSERSLVKIAEELTRFLTKAQRSLAFDTLHLSNRKRDTLAHILVEFSEDLYQDIGIWGSLERYNLEFFGTKLPCILQPDEAMDAELMNPARVQFLLWTLYSELAPDLILAPNHQDLEQLALEIAEFLQERITHVQYDSGVKTFLTMPNQYGWDAKIKLVWLGQHSYLFRLSCEQYIRTHGGTPDIPTLDDFLCQANTCWSGLGVIDMLAATLDISESQRHDLRSWYERHTGYFRVLSAHVPLMEVQNILNDQVYTVRVDERARRFQAHRLVFGALVPWDGEWYWSGMQRGFATVTEEMIAQVKQDFRMQAPQIVYRYCGDLVAKARELVGKHYQQFMEYHGKDLVIYPDGHTMADDMRKFHQYQFDSAPKQDVEAFLKKYHLARPSPKIELPPDILECDDGVGVYCNPDEGQEMMTSFKDVINGFQKQGKRLNEDESEMIRQLLYSDAISPKFVRALVQEYGDASIGSAFLIPQDYDKHYLEYLLRRYKGHFYRKRYPSITIVDTPSEATSHPHL